MLDALGITDSRERVRVPEPRVARMKVVAEMGFGVASVVAPQVAAGWGIDLVALSPFLDAERTSAAAADPDAAFGAALEAVVNFRADFGVVIDAASERVTLLTQKGRLLDGETALHAMVELFCSSCECGSVAVPLHASRVVERIAASHGCSVVRCGRSNRAMSLAALTEDVGFVGDRNGGYMFPSFLAAFDAVMTLGMVAKLLVDTDRTLDDVVEGLPPHFLAESAVACPSGLKGAVMRAMAEATAGLDVEMTEGIRVTTDDGWALVMPDSQDPVVTVYAEADDAATARGLLRRYVGLVEEVVARERA
jgi:mannose-1-phosphate guanylyltransferase/phosphomannomutase